MRYTSFIYGLCEPDWKTIRYVGVTYDLSSRYKYHLVDFDTTHKARWIQSLLNQGLKPKIIILDVVLSEMREEAEREWIRILRESGCDLTNSTDGGEGVWGLHHSEETKEKMRIKRLGTKNTKSSLAKKGVKFSEEHRKNLAASTARRGTFTMKGKKHTEESRKKMSLAQKGRTFSEESKRKMSLAHKGRKYIPLSQESRNKISVAHKGKIVSAETKQKMSLSRRGRPISKEHQDKLRIGREAYYLRLRLEKEEKVL